MTRRSDLESTSLLRFLTGGLVWAAAFGYASSIFLVLQKSLRFLPATRPVAIGLVTIQHDSKIRDYVTAALFYLIVAAGTVLLHAGLARLLERQERRHSGLLPALLLAVPLMCAPLLYLTTRKEMWALILPAALSLAFFFGLEHWERQRWLRSLFTGETRPFHLLVIVEAFSWILFRYLVTGRRIAHIPTLVLESLFVAFFIALVWAMVIFISLLTAVQSSADLARRFRQTAVAASPLLFLAPLGLSLLSPAAMLGPVLALCLITGVVIFRRDVDPSAARWRALVRYGAVPLLLFVFSYASAGEISHWVDLFHRGESLGPASDYLRGRVPYRGVFALHGMLEDGLLDAGLMTLFGRSAHVATARIALISSLMLPAIWLLGIRLFSSQLLVAIGVLLSMVTSVDNQRAVPEIITVLLLVLAFQLQRRSLLLASGAVAGAALFFSFDIGLYSLAAGVLATLLRELTISRESRRWARPLMFLLGAFLGAAPFLIYLATRSALGDFFRDSFVTIPAIIDATWSIPFPDLSSTFRYNLTLHSLSDFFLGEKIRFVLNPLVLCLALVVSLVAWRKRRLDLPLTAVILFALITQRSALGRADYPHQYFSAFLLAPIMLALARSLVRSCRSEAIQPPMVRLFLTAAALLLLIPPAAVALWVPDLLDARLGNLVSYRPRVSNIGFVDARSEDVRDRIESVSTEVQRIVPRDGSIFDFSNQPAFYFFADRPNATRFYQIPILSPLALEREAIRDLEQKRPLVVLRKSPEGYDAFDGVSNEVRAPALARYIDDHYGFYKNVRGVELWKRRVDPGPAALKSYESEFVIPKSVLPAASSFFIFPAVGSVAGAGESHWVSDLLAYNNFSSPVAVKLRYSDATSTSDQRLIFPPGRTTTIRDFVSTLFRRPGSIGSLRIEFENGRPPLLKVQTYDASRAAAPFLEDPLSSGASASAGTEGDEITIVGVVSDARRRVNIGVINSGIHPASFRITVTGSDGRTVGGSIESGLSEDRSYLLVDAQQRLRVSLDGASVIHIRALSGSILGYASVVDGATGAHQLIGGVPSAAR